MMLGGSLLRVFFIHEREGSQTMTNFSTGYSIQIKRFFQTLAQIFFQFQKYLQIYFKKIGDWMSTPIPRSKGVGDGRRATIFRGIL
jgi:hypothetical protein